MGQIGLQEALRIKRTQRGLSARALSSQLGKSPSYVSKVESGDITLSLVGFVEIAIALEMTVYEILYIMREASRQQTKIAS